MPVRARLLDMGQVGPLRAHALRLALAEALGGHGEPVVLVACAAAPAVTIGEDRDLPAEVDLEACAARQVAVLRVPGGSSAAVVGEGALWVSLLLPAAAAAALEMPPSGGDANAWLAGLLAAAGGMGHADSAIEVHPMTGGTSLTARLGFGGGEGLRGLLVGPVPADRGPEGHAPARCNPAEIAEALLQQLERRAGLEMVPSMPTPDELEAVYEWERELAAMAVQAESSSAAAPAV